MKRTHEVTVYRRGDAHTGPRGEVLGETWTKVAEGVPCTIQARSGGIRQREYGQVHQGVYVAFLPAGTGLEAGREYGLLVTSGNGVPARLRTTFVEPLEPGWDEEAELAEAGEDFE